ncbi:hypothetical protein [Streptomyces sp. NPDC001985]|uniref:hypothetical protein n=1 Tax=Streptomyces sp. NPDC001985 TaxID=3154406 RepID=UPI0033345002
MPGRAGEQAVGQVDEHPRVFLGQDDLLRDGLQQNPPLLPPLVVVDLERTQGQCGGAAAELREQGLLRRQALTQHPEAGDADADVKQGDGEHVRQEPVDWAGIFTVPRPCSAATRSSISKRISPRTGRQAFV